MVSPFPLLLLSCCPLCFLHWPCVIRCVGVCFFAVVVVVLFSHSLTLFRETAIVALPSHHFYRSSAHRLVNETLCDGLHPSSPPYVILASAFTQEHVPSYRFSRPTGEGRGEEQPRRALLAQRQPPLMTLMMSTIFVSCFPVFGLRWAPHARYGCFHSPFPPPHIFFLCFLSLLILVTVTVLSFSLLF